MNSWLSAMAQGMTREQVIASVVESDEHRGVLVRGFYSQYLGRRTLPYEGTDWVDRLREGYTRQDVIKGFIASDEFMQQAGGTPQGFIDRSFRTILKRPPTAQDVAQWMNRAAYENIHDTLPNGLLNSTEYFQRLINDYYTAYLRRRPDASVAGAAPFAIDQWLNYLQSGGTPEQLQEALLASPEYYNLAVRRTQDNRLRPRY